MHQGLPLCLTPRLKMLVIIYRRWSCVLKIYACRIRQLSIIIPDQCILSIILHNVHVICVALLKLRYCKKKRTWVSTCDELQCQWQCVLDWNKLLSINPHCVQTMHSLGRRSLAADPLSALTHKPALLKRGEHRKKTHRFIQSKYSKSSFSVTKWKFSL